MLNKKSQISWFVIICVIVVLGFVFFLSFNSKSVNIFNNDKSSYKVKNYVQSCLQIQTKDAIFKIGKKGGWLYHKPLNFASNSKPDFLNKKAEGVDFLDSNQIPYWYFFNDDDNVFEQNIPIMSGDDKYSIENQIKYYLGDNLEKNCLNDFESFDNVYNVFYDKNKILDGLDVKIFEDQVQVILNLNLKIEEINSDSFDSVEHFEILEDNLLWVPYNLAKDIVLAQKNSSFIEHRMISILSSYETSENRNGLIPKSELKLNTYDFKPWRVIDVKNLILQILNSHIFEIKFLNTYNQDNFNSNLKDNKFYNGFYNLYKKDYLSHTSQSDRKVFRKFKDYKVDIEFLPFFPSFLKINPSLGNQIVLPKPEALINILPIFFTKYSANYQIVAPIFFKINSIYDSDFEFLFFIESNINHNEPLSENKDFGHFDFENLKSENNVKSLICDYPQFISEYVYLNISDPVNFGKNKLGDKLKGVENALVNFNCRELANCFVTQTKINGKFSDKNLSLLKFRLPINCFPGTLEIYKMGHKKIKIENLNPNLKDSINLGEIYLPSKKQVKIDFELLSPGLNSNAIGRNLKENENMFLVFKNLEDENLVEVLNVDFKNQFDLTVNLTLGNYSIEGFVLYNKTINIPKEKICVKKDLFGGCDKHQTLEPINISSWLLGEIKVDFEVKLNQLLKYDNLNLKINDLGIPKSYSDLEDYGNNIDSNFYKPFFN